MEAACLADPKLTASKFWPDVRDEIRADAARLAERFAQKCAYCESPATHIQPNTVEHYRPKSDPAHRDRVFAWENWLLVCSVCNTNKGSKLSFDPAGQPLLIDPSAEDPEPLLSFIGCDLHAIASHPRAEHTLNRLKLDRVLLAEARERHIGLLRLFLLAWKTTGQELFRDSLIVATHADAPWAAMARAFLRGQAPELLSVSCGRSWREISAEVARLAALL